MLRITNSQLFSGTDVDDFTESEFKKAFTDKGVKHFTEGELNSFLADINVVIKKGESSALTPEEAEMVEKAHKDVSKLTRKVITNKAGHRQTVFVSAEGEKPAKKKEGKAEEPTQRDSHAEAHARHEHNTKVQRMGKEASLKHIEMKFGKEAAEHVRSKTENTGAKAAIAQLEAKEDAKAESKMQADDKKDSEGGRNTNDDKPKGSKDVSNETLEGENLKAGDKLTVPSVSGGRIYVTHVKHKGNGIHTVEMSHGTKKDVHISHIERNK